MNHPEEVKAIMERPTRADLRSWLDELDAIYDKIFALEKRASADPRFKESMVRSLLYSARCEAGKAENVLRFRFKQEGVE